MRAPQIRIDTETYPPPQSLPHLARVTLEIVRGKARRLVRRVMPPVFVIGAAADCDLVLADERFPEAYAYVYVTTRGVTVRHLGAPPELLVNGLPAQSARLEDGDRLAMGDYEFQINIHQEDPDGGGIRAHDADTATVPFDRPRFRVAVSHMHQLLGEIRSTVNVPLFDLKVLTDPAQDQRQELKRLATRPLAAFVARRVSA